MNADDTSALTQFFTYALYLKRLLRDANVRDEVALFAVHEFKDAPVYQDTPLNRWATSNCVRRLAESKNTSLKKSGKRWTRRDERFWSWLQTSTFLERYKERWKYEAPKCRLAILYHRLRPRVAPNESRYEFLFREALTEVKREGIAKSVLPILQEIRQAIDELFNEIAEVINDNPSRGGGFDTACSQVKHSAAELWMYLPTQERPLESEQQIATDVSDSTAIRVKDIKLPSVTTTAQSGKIIFAGETFCEVNLDACEALKIICEHHPQPVGLSSHFTQKPKRIVDRLPVEIRSLLIASRKGYRLQLPELVRDL